MEEHKKFCPQCGRPASAAGRFCGRCGYRFEDRQQNAPAPSPSPAQPLREPAAQTTPTAAAQTLRVSPSQPPEPEKRGDADMPEPNAPQEKRFCRRCGNAVSASARFCNKCGFRFDAPPAVPAAPIAAQGTFPGKDRRGHVKDSPLGTAAREGLRDVLPSPGRAKRFGKGAVAAVLAFAILLTGLGWPGWIRHMFDRPETPPLSWDGGTGTGGGGSASLAVGDLATPLNVGYLDGVGEGVGLEDTYVETPVVSVETLSVPSDGAAVTASCGASIELGELNAGAVDEITVTQHAPETQTIPGGARVCYDIDAGERHGFDYFFDISLPYDPAGTDPDDEAVSVFAEWLDEETGEWEPELCDVDTVNKRVIIHTDHFSSHAAVTVQQSELTYVELATLGDLSVVDEAAMQNLKAHIGELAAEHKQDPIAVAIFYHLIFKTAEFGSFGLITEQDIEEAAREAYGQLDGTFTDMLGWMASFAYDVGTYAEIVPPESLQFVNGSVSYLPGKLFSMAANFATYLSAASLAETVYEELQQTGGDLSRNTAMSLYKWLLYYGFGKVLSALGVSFGSLLTVPLLSVDYILYKVDKSVQEAEDDAMSKALYDYYKEYYARPLFRDLHKRSDISGEDLPQIEKQCWMNRLMPVFKENIRTDEKALATAVKNALEYDIAQAYTGLSLEVHGDGDMAIAMQGGIPDGERRNVWSTWETLDPSRRTQVSTRAAMLLMRDLEPVFLEMAKQHSLALRRNAVTYGAQVNKALNTLHVLTIEEKIPNGEKSRYAGCKVLFTYHEHTEPGRSDTRLVQWQGTLDSNGCMTVQFNTLGYLKAGVPDRVQIFAPDASTVDGRPMLEVDFAIRQEKTRIVLGDVPYTWFEGSWHWEDTHGTESRFDDEGYDLAILSVDATHAYMRETDVWGDGGMNLLYAEYDAYEDALILSDLGTGEPVLVLEKKGAGPDRIAVTGLSSEEVTMTRTQQDDTWWNDRRLERDQLIQMAADQGYLAR